MSAQTPIRILIAAMGGEGGGVLAGWITQAAVASGHAVQRTSIPGVAQRTGATTYYLEIMPGAGSTRPVLALNPAPGEVEIVLATELLEAARAAQAGFIIPDRTLLIASAHRVYTVVEKAAMADGRLDSERLLSTVRHCARTSILADLAALAQGVQSPLNAVMLGALAASGALPIEAAEFRRTIEADGKAVEANLRGFEAGLRTPQLVSGREARRESAHPLGSAESMPRASGRGQALSLEERALLLAPGAGEIAVQGVRRLIDYQDEAYARLYLDRLERVARSANAAPDFLRELARLLAVRMSFEDTIRVAQLKLKSARLVRVRAEAKARPGDVIHITEFLKPGPEELLGVLPPGIARPLLGFLESRGWMNLAIPMRVSTTGLLGFAQLRILASLRRLRPASLRFIDEQDLIERWLHLIERALPQDGNAALEIVETVNLVKGYGETLKRGLSNWRTIADEVIEPMLRGDLPIEHFADAVLQTRLAAMADPAGNRLRSVIEGIRGLRPAAPTLAAAE